jgi:hypothetical protein
VATGGTAAVCGDWRVALEGAEAGSRSDLWSIVEPRSFGSGCIEESTLVRTLSPVHALDVNIGAPKRFARTGQDLQADALELESLQMWGTLMLDVFRQADGRVSFPG